MHTCMPPLELDKGKGKRGRELLREYLGVGTCRWRLSHTWGRCERGRDQGDFKPDEEDLPLGFFCAGPLLFVFCFAVWIYLVSTADFSFFLDGGTVRVRQIRSVFPHMGQRRTSLTHLGGLNLSPKLCVVAFPGPCERVSCPDPFLRVLQCLHSLDVTTESRLVLSDARSPLCAGSPDVSSPRSLRISVCADLDNREPAAVGTTTTS